MNRLPIGQFIRARREAMDIAQEMLASTCGYEESDAEIIKRRRSIHPAPFCVSRLGAPPILCNRQKWLVGYTVSGALSVHISHWLMTVCTASSIPSAGVYIVSMVVLLVGYAFVIQQTPAFNAIITALTSISGSGLMWACALCMMIAIGVSSNPMAGMLTNLNVVAPHFLNAGLPARVIFRIGMTTNAIFDTLPTNVGILVAHDISDVKLRDGYFACFMVTCVAPALMTLTNLVLLQFGL